MYLIKKLKFLMLMTKDLLWSSFDDAKSVYLKAKFIRDEGYGGSMFFDLNSDDFTFKCSLNKRFVLQSIISDVLTGRSK